MSTQISPDGMYYWDGTNWVSTLSHDGRSRWNGTAWVPVGGAPVVGYQPAPARVPTSWTKPLQYAVAGWYALSGLYALSLPFWMTGPITDVVNQSIQRQEALNPSATPLPSDFASTMASLTTGILWVAAVFGVVVCAVIVIGALSRWTWIYYAVLVLLGLSAISLPLTLLSAASGSVLSGASGFSMPIWTYWVGVLFGLPGIALFVWMIVAIVRRGPWGMVRPATA